MGRVGVALSVLAAVLAGFVGPASARSALTPADALTGGAVTLAGNPATGELTSTFTGQFAAGGRVFTGTAAGTVLENDPYDYLIDASGTSSTGSMSASCIGNFLQPDGVGTLPSQTPQLMPLSCSVTIDGAPAQNVEVILALEATGTFSYTGAFAAAPDAEGLPAVPLVSLWSASAEVQNSGIFDGISLGFQGQISLGTQTFRGSAGGDEAAPTGPVIPVSSFVLSGTSATGTLNATCSGVFVGEAVALSVLLCNGSVNGGSPGPGLLVGAYAPVTPGDLNGNADYSGVFAGAG